MVIKMLLITGMILQVGGTPISLKVRVTRDEDACLRLRKHSHLLATFVPSMNISTNSTNTSTNEINKNHHASPNNPKKDQLMTTPTQF